MVIIIVIIVSVNMVIIIMSMIIIIMSIIFITQKSVFTEKVRRMLGWKKMVDRDFPSLGLNVGKVGKEVDREMRTK